MYLLGFLPEVFILEVRMIGDAASGTQLHSCHQLHASTEGSIHGNV